MYIQSINKECILREYRLLIFHIIGLRFNIIDII